MKKLKIIFLTSISILAINISMVSASGGYEPGIYKKTSNDSKVYSYEEVTFVTGKPVLLKGTLTRTKIDKEKENDILKKEIDKKEKSSIKKNPKKSFNKKNNSNQNFDPIPDVKEDFQIDYKGSKINEKYNLSGEGIKLTRELTISPSNNYYKGQILQTNKISKIKETISFDGETYNLDPNLTEISESIVIDKKPVIDYHAGNSNFYKVFTSAKGNNSQDSKKIIIQMDGKTSGYDEFWGETTTKQMNYTINTQLASNTDDKNQEKKDEKVVNGTYSVKLSQNKVKDLSYSENDPKKISFNGGYIITTQNNAAMEYTYDINGISGKGQSENENLPDIKRLFAPVLTDIQGHYAEDAIKIITSMNGFDIGKKVFLPNAPISRDEFARAVVVTSGLYDNNSGKKSQKKVLKEELFVDVKKIDSNYNYIKKAVDKKLMIGRDDNKFEPKNPITKAEAIKILTNSLGLESILPNGKYNTGFEDEASIPSWAFESAYIAQNIGLVEKGGVLNPNEELTKAEASELLLRYIEYMTGDLKEDYMHKILNY